MSRPEAKWRWMDDYLVRADASPYDFPLLGPPGGEFEVIDDEARALLPWTPNLLELVREWRLARLSGDLEWLNDVAIRSDALLAAIDGEGGANV